MAQDKLEQAQKLINAGKFAAARRVLSKLDNPQAREMLRDLNEIDPPDPDRWSAKDYLQVVLIGLVSTLLFGGIGFAVSAAIGIPQIASPTINQTVAPGSTPLPVVATSTPTPTPTPTPIPCLATEWWAANQAPLTQAMNLLLNLSVKTPVPEVQAAQGAFGTWAKALETTPISPCLSAVQASIVAAAPAVDRAFSAFTGVSTAQSRAQALIPAVDALLRVADELPKLEIGMENDTTVQAVVAYTRGACPARRWFTEIIEARGYGRFLTQTDALNTTLNSNAPAGATPILQDLRSLRSSFVVDTATFPDCVGGVRQNWLDYMDGILSYANERLNGNMGAAGQELQKAQTALSTFYVELGRLEPLLADVKLG